MLQDKIKIFFNRPEVIETGKIMLMNILFPAVAMILCILEVSLSICIDTIGKEQDFVKILTELSNAGFFILIVMILYSVSFNYFVNGIKLEIPRKYENRALKGIFSLAGILTFIFYYLLIKYDPSLVKDPAWIILIRKILSWAIAIVGIWVGMDIQVKDINKNKSIQKNAIIQNEYEKLFSLKFKITFVIAFILYVLLIIADIFLKNLQYIFMIILIILCMLLAVLVILGKKRLK